MLSAELDKVVSSLRWHLWGGALILVLLAGGLGTWAAYASLQSAVVAPAIVVVQSESKHVQHQDGGIVAEIAVVNGDRVEGGQVLITLDGEQLKAEHAIVLKRVYELSAIRWRLGAERDQLKELPSAPKPDAANIKIEGGDLTVLIDVQERLFRSRREFLNGRQEQLRERINQLEQEIAGLSRILKSRTYEKKSVDDEFTGLSGLRDRQLVPTSRVNQLDRDSARLEGEIGRIEADMAKTKGQITEIKLQLLELDERFLTEVLNELQKTEGELAQLSEKQHAIADRLKRLEIRAPVSGRVHEVAVHTIGGVIRAGETLLLVVPEQDDLVLDARVRPQDIDRVHQQQAVRARFPAFDQRTTPDLLGRVIWVSPDQANTGEGEMPYFKVRVRLDDGQLGSSGDLALAPGMPAEVLITSGERSAFSYLVKPIADQFQLAFREK